MTVPSVRTPEGHVWTCDVCGSRSLWTDTHVWLGSWKDMDDCNWGRIFVSCSRACLIALRARHPEGELSEEVRALLDHDGAPA